MGYAQYMADLLAPMAIFDVAPGSVIRGELEAMGGALDALAEEVEALEREGNVLTAEGCGLENWETLLPWRSTADGVFARRQALTALLRIGGDDFTTDALRQALAGCGAEADIRESETEAHTVEITFPGLRGVPADMDRVREIVEGIVPCHLGIVYRAAYLDWGELEENFGTWDDLEAAGLTWNWLEVFDPAG